MARSPNKPNKTKPDPVHPNSRSLTRDLAYCFGNVSARAYAAWRYALASWIITNGIYGMMYLLIFVCTALVGVQLVMAGSNAAYLKFVAMMQWYLETLYTNSPSFVKPFIAPLLKLMMDETTLKRAISDIPALAATKQAMSPSLQSQLLQGALGLGTVLSLCANVYLSFFSVYLYKKHRADYIADLEVEGWMIGGA